MAFCDNIVWWFDCWNKRGVVLFGGTKQLILPHIIEVSLGFTPIGSDTAGHNLISKKSTTTSHIAQNNTGTDAGTLQYIK